MKLIAQITLGITLLLFTSCTGDLNDDQAAHENIDVHISDSASAFKELLLKRVKKQSEINAEIALQSILELFETNSNYTVSNEEAIDIYVIYSIGTWGEYDVGETFQIAFAHQTVEDKDLYEYSVTFIYESSKFARIKEFDARYDASIDNIEEFKSLVRDSPGFKKSILSSPKKIVIEKVEI
jgi:hypothetical protein